MTVTKDFKGKTIEDAVMNAVSALGIDRDEIFYEVVERPRSGFLGIGKSDAIVRITYDIPDAPPQKTEKPQRTERPARPQQTGAAENKPKAEQRPAPPRPQQPPKPQRTEAVKPAAPQNEAKPAEKKPVVEQKPPVFVPGNETSQKAEGFLNGLFEIMGVDAKMNSMVDVENNIINIDLSGDNMGFVIGRRGETLDALQYLATIYTNRTEDARWRVSLDTENYREKRTQALVALANKTASNVVKQNKSIALEPMNPQERRVIHAALQDNKAVTTFSTGSEPRRKIVIAPAGQKRGGKSIKQK